MMRSAYLDAHIGAGMDPSVSRKLFVFFRPFNTASDSVDRGVHYRIRRMVLRGVPDGVAAGTSQIFTGPRIGVVELVEALEVNREEDIG